MDNAFSSSTVLVSDREKETKDYRLPPYNVQAEQAVIGAILINNDLIHKVSDMLAPECFFEQVHQRIYHAIQIFIEKGLVATPVTLKNHFDKDMALADIGGSEYLVNLASLSTAVINLEAYGRVIYEAWQRRNLIQIGEEIVNESYEDELGSSVNNLVEKAEQKLFSLSTTGVGEKGFEQLKHSLANAIAAADIAHKRDEKLSGIDTGFEDTNKLLGGFQNSDLLILAGRPSMGKTALAINFAVESCKRMYANHKDDSQPPPGVGFFSLEMSAEQLAARMIAMESGVNSSRMRLGTMEDSEFEKIVKSNQVLHKLPFFIDDTPALSIGAVRTRCRRLKRKHNLGFLIVDYLQLLRGTAKSSEANRVQEVSEITQGLKAIAKELNIPVIALSQLSRSVESRDDKRPQLSDLRESGSIEQDADVVMFIFREEYYLMRQEPETGTEKHEQWQERMNKCMNVSDIIVAKHRNGPIGTVSLHFNSNTTKFNNYENREAEY